MPTKAKKAKPEPASEETTETKAEAEAPAEPSLLSRLRKWLDEDA